nr:NTP transferase domain-containing protein [candidate division Zixibacteria bacterium]
MKQALKIIIPVAGVGTRMRPHTFTAPKPLIPVAGKPILSHIIDPLAGLNPAEVVFVVGYLGGQIVDFIKTNYQFNATFVEQTDLLGLGFAIHLALRETSDSPCLIILGDTIARTDYKRFISKKGNIVGLKKVEDPRRFGVALVENEKVIALEEKPKNPRSDLALIGLYYFEDSAPLRTRLEKLIKLGKKTGGEIQLTDAMEFMIKDGIEFKPFEVDNWYDCGKRETLLNTNRALLSESSEVADYPGSVIVPPVYISPLAEIEDSIIGPNVSISEYARVSRSIIRESIISSRATIEDSLLEESVVGSLAVIRGTFQRLNIGNSSETGYF